jgi:hypothetical protein
MATSWRGLLVEVTTANFLTAGAATAAKVAMRHTTATPLSHFLGTRMPFSLKCYPENI